MTVIPSLLTYKLYVVCPCQNYLASNFYLGTFLVWTCADSAVLKTQCTQWLPQLYI